MTLDAPSELARGRDSFARRAWSDAHQSLRLADRDAPLGAGDLERLAVSAFLVGCDDEFLLALERAHHAWLLGGEGVRAARGAFWLGLVLLLRGETGRAGGWLGRAHRLIERIDCVERGYLLLPAAEQHLDAGRVEAANAAASEAASIGERFEEPDLVACARHVQGRALLEQRRVEEGLALLDEAMIAVAAGELTPIMTGLIYCSVIDACQRAYALDRAREWTNALSRWCEEQPDLVAFTGTCRVHRAEILQWSGAWPEAIAEALRACARFARGLDPRPPAGALYRQGEVHRLRGDFAAAEAAYRGASQAGLEPQPGLALLRLTEGRIDVALAAMRRVMVATPEPLERTRLLPAHIEILLEAGEVEEAAGACLELEQIADGFGTEVLAALAAQARGAVELAAGDIRAALGPLRRAWGVWRQIEAPYLEARVRVLAGRACRALGDDEGAGLELEAARGLFERLGATPDLAHVDALLARPPAPPTHRLTARELQVLRLVAAGRTNRAIGAELHLSERTIDRHVSNILTKLDVPSRAAATAYAYEHQLLSPR
jgi:DNA-binding CsgD family transcriptional regulator